jgi:protein TonB
LKVNPEYPRLAIKARSQGVIILEVLVDRDGIPQKVQVLRSVPLLESAAIAAVEQWRWTPYRIGGKEIPFWVMVTVTFKLADVRAAS